MKVDVSDKGLFQSLIYVFSGVYAWIDGVGIDARIMTALAVLMLLDMITGIWKSIVVKELNNPSSKTAKKGILTKFIVFVIPAVVGLIWWALGDKDTAIRVVNVLLSGIMVAEGYSNIGNAYTIYTGEVLSEFDAVTFMFKKVGGRIQKLLEKTLDYEK